MQMFPLQGDCEELESVNASFRFFKTNNNQWFAPLPCL